MDVTFPGFGSIVVQGRRYDHDVVIADGIVRPRDKAPSRALAGGGHTPLSAAEEIPWSKPLLVIGTGHSGRLPVLDGVREEAAARGVELAVVTTAEACELLGTLDASEVNAILHVTC